MPMYTDGPSVSADREIENAVTAGLVSYPREPMPPQFITRVMAEVGRSPQPTRRQHARLSAIDFAVPAGVALITLALIVSFAWLEAVDPTAIPRATRWVSVVQTLLPQNLPLSGAGTTAIAASVASLAALAVALVMERLVPRPRAR